MVTYNLRKWPPSIGVCFLNNDFGGKTGSGRFCLALVRTLTGLGVDVECRVLARGSFNRSKLAGIRMLFHLRQIAKNIHVIHALDGWPYGFIAVVASLGLNKKVIITAVGTGAVQPLYRRFKKPLMVWAYRKADKVVAVSSNTRREILKVLPDLEIEVINHGVDVSKFEIRNPKFETNPKIQNLKPYILSVGALKKRKGYEYSIKAFAEISKKFPDLKYVIVGKGQEREALQLLTTHYSLQAKVIFFEKVEEDFLVSLYRNAELFILLPQDYNKDIEGFGLVFLEAAASGLPVVATKATSAEDAVLDGRNGILVPSGGHEGAAWALSEILSSAGLRSSLAGESVKLARSMSWERAAKRYRSAYRDIMGS